jgi:hypothetical protein
MPADLSCFGVGVTKLLGNSIPVGLRLVLHVLDDCEEEAGFEIGGFLLGCGLTCHPENW